MSARHPKLASIPKNLLRPCRQIAVVIVGLAAIGLFEGGATSAQQPGTKKTIQKVDKFLVTEDGWQIAITYRNSLLGQNAPVVLLIPRLGNDRLVWEGKGGFAERLSGEGYAVVSIDLRKHGESKGPDDGAGGSRKVGAASLRPDDYERMVDNDLEAVKRFLYSEHQAKNLNMNKIGIVSAESSAPIAILFTLRDWLKRPYPDGATLESSTPRGQDVRALVFLSPEANLRGAPTNDALLDLRNPEWQVATLTCFGTLDTASEQDAKRIYSKLSGISINKRSSKPDKKLSGKSANDDSIHYLQSYPFKLRGTDLLLKKEVNCEDDILVFLKGYIKELPGEWRDRKNRLTAN